MIKRVIFALLLFFLVTAPFVKSVHAIAQWKQETEESHGGALDGEAVDLQSSNFVTTQDIQWGFTCQIIGRGCTADPTQIMMYMRNSASGKISNTIADMYNTKAADFGLWLADTGHSLGFMPKPAYAQGIGVGFTGMAALLPLWKAFRNIAYLLMAIVMIVIGFMVMFRKKIDPKTVVTAQNAIPRVIIALILITFSYAIVGLMIDAMYIVLFFFVTLFKSAGLQDPTNGLVTGVYGADTAQKLYGQSGLMANMINVEVNPWQLLFGIQQQPVLGLPDWGSALIGVVLALVGGLTPVGIVGGIAFLAIPLVHFLIALFVLFLFIRLLAFFLSSYIQIIISLLLGPLQFLAEAFPGSNAFSSWFKNLVANLAVFPIGGAMFMLSALFAQFANDANGAAVWKPPYTALGGNNVSISALLSLGILFAIPTVAGSIKEALKAKPAVPMLDFGGAGGAGAQWVSTLFYLKSMVPSQFWSALSGKQGSAEHKPQHG